MSKNGIAPWQNKRFHALLGPLKLSAEDKAQLVASFSVTGATSSKDLLYSEAGQLITHLERAGTHSGTTEAHERAERQRGKVLSLAHELRWHLPNGKVDMGRVDEWCSTHGPAKKPLNLYPADKLATLISQLVIVRDNFLKSLYNANDPV
jgi:hypothetical protein